MRYDAAQINRFDLTRYPDYRGDFPPDVYQLHRFGHLEEYEAESGRRWGANGIGRLHDVALSRPTGKKGDRIFYYDSGDERAVVGIVKAVSDAYPDPEDPSGKYVAVDVAPVKRSEARDARRGQGRSGLQGLPARAHRAAVRDASDRCGMGANRTDIRQGAER